MNIYKEMKKINKVVGEAKVSMRERIGKKESLSEVPDYLIDTRTLSEIKGSTKEILSKLSKQSKLNQSMIEDNAALGEDIIDLGNYFLGEEGNCQPLGNGLRTLGDLYIQMEVCRSKLDISVTSRLAVPQQEFAKNELKDAYLAKSRYDKFRISFDAASEQFKNARKKSSTPPEKLQDLEANLNQVTQEFSSVANESLYQMEDIIDRYNADTFDRVYDSVKIYQEYFQRGLEVINNILPDMEQHKTSMLKVKQQTTDKRKKRDLQPVQFEPRQQTSLSNSGNFSKPTSNNSGGGGGGSSQVQSSNNKVFGIPLTVISEREGKNIPLIVEKSIEYLENNSLDTEGVFRVSPNQKFLNELKGNITSCGGIGASDKYIETCDDVHIISAFLKSFLREMPIPLLTFELYKPLVKSVLEMVDQNKSCNTITELLSTLPPSHLSVTKSLIELLYKISKNSQVNKMTSSNLAVVLAPNILYPKQLDIQAINDSNATIEFFITNYPQIFDKININLRNSGGSSSSSSSSSNGSGNGNSNGQRNSGGNSNSIGNGNGQRNSGGNNTQTSSPVVSKDPPKVPTRPQTIVFKAPPVILTPNTQTTTSAPTTPKSPLPPTPASPIAKRLSSSGSVLPSPSSNMNNSPQTSSLSSSSGIPNQPKAINNRVSVYLQNVPPPNLPPKPSASNQKPSTNNNPNQSLNNSGGISNKSSLPPLPNTNNNNRKRPAGILVNQGSSVSNEGSKLTYNLLDDSITISNNNYGDDDDNLIEW